MGGQIDWHGHIGWNFGLMELLKPILTLWQPLRNILKRSLEKFISRNVTCMAGTNEP
jgi:hypothetical protein